MKKVLVSLLSLVMVFGLVIGLSACGNSSTTTTAASGQDATTAETTAAASGDTQGEKTFKFGLSIDDMSADFCASIANAAQAAADELGVELQVTDAGIDIALQTSQVENMIANGCDAIILKAYDGSSNAGISEACTKAGVPLIVVVAPISTECTAFVGQDDYELGRLMAQSLIDAMGTTDFKVAELMGPLAQENLVITTNGWRSVFEENNIEIVASDCGENKMDVAMEKVEAWVSAGIEFDAVISLSDAMAIGANNVLETAGIRDNVYIIASGGDKEGCEAIKAGKLNQTIYSSGSQFGDAGVRLAFQIVNGGENPGEVYIENEPITPDNVDEFLNK